MVAIEKLRKRYIAQSVIIISLLSAVIICTKLIFE